MKSSFPAHSAFLVSSEGTGRIKFVVGIGPKYPGLNFSGYIKYFRSFVGPDATAKTVGCIVRFLHYFFECTEGLYGQHRSEDFFLYNFMRLRYIGEQSRTEPDILSRERLQSLCQHSPPSLIPAFTSDFILLNCALELIAPTSVFLSSGSPTIKCGYTIF
jgi:hypothetical protein